MWPELEAGWSVVGIGDFNGDGISDLLIRSDTGYLTDWLGVAGGGFDQNDANAGTGIADTSWQVAGVGNFNTDGHSDILWRNDGGYTTEWLSTSNGGFVSNQANAGTGAADNSWKIIGIGDFNGDHISDILWRNDNGYITEWLGTSTGAFVSNESNAGTSIVDSIWHVAGVGDFNGDGRSDVLWRNDSGYVTEWVGNANGGFTSNEANAGTGAAPASSTIAGIGDFNGDGKADLLWRASDGTITDWLGQANGGFVDNSAAASQPLDLSLKIDGVGDFNGDGKADVLIQWSDGTLQTWDGSDSGAILSPMEKQWEDAFADAQAFMAQRAQAMGEMAAAMAQVSAAEINAAVQSIQGMPTPQIDDMTSEMSTAVADMWYMASPSLWGNAAPTVDPAWAGMANEINASLSAAVGSGLTFTLSDSGGFSASSGLNFESLSPIDQSNGIFDINIDGMDFVAHWGGGAAFAAPDPNDPNAIVVTGTRPLPMLFMPSGFNVEYAENAFNPLDGFGGMGAPSHDGHVTITAAMRLAVIHKLSSDPKFWAFKLNGVDIDHAILQALSKDTIYFSDDNLPAGATAHTDAGDNTIQVATAFENDPVGLAMLLAHEGLHQAMFDLFADHDDSMYEEALGKLISAYVYSGLSSTDQQFIANDANPTVHSFYNGTMTVVGLSDQHNFQGIMNYVAAMPAYSTLDEYPVQDIYNKIGGSF